MEFAIQLQQRFQNAQLDAAMAVIFVSGGLPTIPSPPVVSPSRLSVHVTSGVRLGRRTNRVGDRDAVDAGLKCERQTHERALQVEGRQRTTAGDEGEIFLQGFEQSNKRAGHFHNLDAEGFHPGDRAQCIVKPAFDSDRVRGYKDNENTSRVIDRRLTPLIGY